MERGKKQTNEQLESNQDPGLNGQASGSKRERGTD